MKNYCEPCWRRKRRVVLATHIVVAEGFCDSCFGGGARMPREKYLKHPKAEPGAGDARAEPESISEGVLVDAGLPAGQTERAGELVSK